MDQTTTAAARARLAVRPPAAPRAAGPRAIAAAALVLALPALLNGFPFLFWDTGGYLAAAAERTLTPGRSTTFGLMLMLGSWPDFWPLALAQCALAAWMIALVLRVHRLDAGGWRLAGLCAVLALLTALPLVAGELMPDIFAGLASLALFLLVFHDNALGRRERAGLVAVVALAGASHASILAIGLTLVIPLVGVVMLRPRLRARLRLGPALLGLAGALVLTPTVNLLVAGQFAPTPGGTAFVFGRLLEDGMVERYLDRHCPDATLPLCAWRGKLPETANDFLWDDADAFNAIGGMERGAPVMLRVILGSLAEEPLPNLTLAGRAFALQLVTAGSGEGLLNYLTDSYDVIQRYVPSAYPAMMRAHQQAADGLDFSAVDRLHMPVALGALALLAPAALLAWRAGRADLALLAGAALAILLANAAVCGILSYPTDRYQSRISWVAVLALAVLALSAARAFRRRWRGMP